MTVKPHGILGALKELFEEHCTMIFLWKIK